MDRAILQNQREGWQRRADQLRAWLSQAPADLARADRAAIETKLRDAEARVAALDAELGS